MSLSGFSDGFARVFKKLLPSPFGIAVSLTLFVFLVALCFMKPPEISFLSHAENLAFSWQEGLFQSNLLTFAFQMAFMLVLGHALALTKPFSQAIDLLTSVFCKNTALAAFGVTLLTVMVALFNWGLGLIFGAIFARKVGEYALQRNIPLNYPLIGAAGYSGLMVWHGGFSGSSLSKIAEPGELLSKAQGLYADKLALVPEAITYDETVFSSMNISISWALILILPAVMYWLGKRKPSEKTVRNLTPASETIIVSKVLGAERIDHLSWVGIGFGLLMLLVASVVAWNADGGITGWKFINPNWINLVLFGLALTLHKTFSSFLKGVDEGIVGAAGILVQFPLYFGILGLMTSSGLVECISHFFVSVSTPATYPVFTFISAGIVNIFVPSGGGQWAIQGPIIIQSALEIGVPLNKSILAMAYGDQLTNMLQPFWALPLLGITGLRAKEILPYTLVLMLVGALIFVVGLVIF